MTRELQVLAELSVAALALIAVIIFAYTVYNRSKSDTGTIKVFADLLSTSYNTISENVIRHGDESTTRNLEVVSTLQIMNQLLLQHIASDNDMSQSVKNLSDNVGAYTTEVKKTGERIMDKVTPLDQVLAAIHAELKLLRQSVDAHLENSIKFRDDVEAKTQTIEVRLLQVEKRATQETPVIETDDSKPQTKEESKS